MKEMIEALEAGRVFDAGRTEAPASDILKTLLLIASGELQAPFGLRISRASITGLLDLSGVSGPEDAPWCPIKFLDCDFDEGLRLDRSRFKRLSLHGSRFHRLQARDAEFLSTLDLRDVRSPAQPPPGHAQIGPQRHVGRRPLSAGECSIDLANTVVDGDIWLHRAVLKAGAAYGDEATIGPFVYALTLRSAEVRGAVRLEPCFEARGGVTVADAHIHGDLRMHGARLIGDHGAALRAQNARVDGIVYCRADTSPGANGVQTSRPFTARGTCDGALIFQNAKLGRLDVRGAVVMAAGPKGSWTPSGARDRAGVALDLSHAVVSAGVVAGAVIGPRHPSRFRGWVTLRAARIQGDVSFSRVRVTAIQAFRAISEEALNQARSPHYAVNLRSADIRGSVRLDNGFKANGGVTVADANIGGDLVVEGAVLTAFEGPGIRLALRGRNTSLAGVLRCGNLKNEVSIGSLTCVGGISFPNASMDKADLDGVSVTATQGDVAIDFTGARIRGGLSIRPTTKPAIVRPCIHGAVHLNDADIRGDVHVESALGPSQSEETGAFIADGARISGDFTLERLVGHDGSTSPVEIGLSGASIGRNLFVRLPHTLSGSRLHTVFRAPAVAIDGDAAIYGAPHERMQLELSGARIGRSLDLHFLHLDGPHAAGMKIGGQFILTHSRLWNQADFTAMQVEDSMQLFTLAFLKPDKAVQDPRAIDMERRLTRLSLSGSRVTRSLRVRGLTSDDHRDLELDLTDVSVGILDDLAGTAWPWTSTLALRGLTYREIKFDESDKTSRWPELDRDLKHRHRKSIAKHWKWFGGSTGLALAAASLPLIATRAPGLGAHVPDTSAALWFGAAIFCAALPLIGLSLDRLWHWNNLRRVHYRLSWLDRQFGVDVDQLVKRFVPQPYTQLAKAYRGQGRHMFADTTLIRRARMKARTGLDRRSEESERAGPGEGVWRNRLRYMWRFFTVAAPNWLFDATFRYGLSPLAAVATLGCYIAVGFCLTMAETSVAGSAPADRGHRMGCAAQLTLERVVPPLDLDSARLCAPAASAGDPSSAKASKARPGERTAARAAPAERGSPLWAVFWAVYGLFGWIVTSLTTLTLTGVLRRFAEH